MARVQTAHCQLIEKFEYGSVARTLMPFGQNRADRAARLSYLLASRADLLMGGRDEQFYISDQGLWHLIAFVKEQ